MSSPPENESFEMTHRPVTADEDEPSESTSVTSIDTPKPEDGQGDTQAASDKLLTPDKEETTEQTKPPMHIECPLENHVLYSLIMIIFVGITALVSACWLVAHIQIISDKGYIEAEVIGGTLSSTEAKLIDAAFSMLVAPTIVAITNWHMFKLARLSAVNEHRGRSSAVSMKVLVEVAGTDWGSLSPLKFWTFIRSKRPRVVCLGAIAVLSALSFSLLGNVVAYQQADTGASVHEVQANIDEYTMTFVPWILLSGLITLGIACALTVGLSLDSWKVYSLRSGRMLDSIRLTADVGVALDKKVFEECSTWHGTKLNKCADEARFQYEADARLNSETGHSTGIRLRQISRPHD
ncbi:hypothetical protein FSARC_11402 [Fusarium sarcochroum]|uniref:Uncharacterized protein n=1 Tax=Fusarium sarcochroum TaxID=1208366 RepID=A0A8H4WZZ5_9HYPO|nr:hypothetical protein FSARC_11402 [Fusarium sarcochroum]